MDHSETLIGVASIATALAGFTGVVVAFGSRAHGAWHPGDRLRLAFLLEASLTGAGFALLALAGLALEVRETVLWPTVSVLWALYMVASLIRSSRRIRHDLGAHGDIDVVANRIVAATFVVLVAAQFANAALWQAFGVFLLAVLVNLVGAAMQFARLVRSAFRE